jgi:hypothetical protein
MTAIERRAIEMILAWREFREAFRSVLKTTTGPTARFATRAWDRMDEATELCDQARTRATDPHAET